MIELLVDRLRWPAPLVRERAASQIGQLILDGDREARDALVAWIDRQELESLAALGLLPFLFATSRGGENTLPTNELSTSCRARSVLSELYLSELDSSHLCRPELGRHSGSPPLHVSIPSQVSTESTSLLETSVFKRVETLQDIYRVALKSQFDFEMSVLCGDYVRSPVQASWTAGDWDRGYHPGWQTLDAEVCLSAYLRTLAWAASNEYLPHDTIVEEAAKVSPVDLGLWNVQPTVAPKWWPSLETRNGQEEVDTEIADVIRKVNSVADAWGTGPYVVLAASGCLSQTNLAQYDLEVRSFFQQPYGPNRPMAQELFAYLSSVRGSIRQDQSPLRFEGVVDADLTRARLADWFIVPSSVSAFPKVPIIWQTWRGIRRFQSPSDFLANGDIRLRCKEESIDYESKGVLIARWSDWTKGLSALVAKDLLPANGWVLVAHREVVDRFVKETGMNLAWVWEIASRFRKYSYGDFKEHLMYFDYGTSSIIRP